MRTIRRIVLRINSPSDMQAKAVLEEAGIKFKRGDITVELDEQDPTWPRAERICLEFDLIHDHRYSVFTDDERASAQYLEISPRMSDENPRPWRNLERLKEVCDTREMCPTCFKGARQIAPLRLKKAPRWGEHWLFNLIWYFDSPRWEMPPHLNFTCVREDVYMQVLEPAGVPCQPLLLDGSETVVPGVVQIQPSQSAQIATAGLPLTPCESCGGITYNQPWYGFRPAVLGATAPLVESAEWFGVHKRLGEHLLMVSQALYRQLRELDKAELFIPCAEI